MGRICQSYRAKEITCADGFIQKPFCAGRGGCFSCGTLSSNSLPHCLSDELPDHWVKDDGSPIFYKPDPPHLKG